MLNSLYELGKFWIEKENLDKIDVLVDAAKLKTTKKVILVELNQKEDSNYSSNSLKLTDSDDFEFVKVSLKEYGSEDNLKYLYKFGSTAGTNITPSCLIKEVKKTSCLIKEVKKTYNKKFLKWFEQNKKEDIFLNSIFNCLNINSKRIIEEINNLYNEIKSSDRTNVILTLGIKEDNSLRFVGDYEIFKEILIQNANERFYLIKPSKKKLKVKGPAYYVMIKKKFLDLFQRKLGLHLQLMINLVILPKWISLSIGSKYLFVVIVHYI